jgi:hypothetical protein
MNIIRLKKNPILHAQIADLSGTQIYFIDLIKKQMILNKDYFFTKINFAQNAKAKNQLRATYTDA